MSTALLIAVASCVGSSPRDPAWRGLATTKEARRAPALGVSPPMLAAGEQLFYRISLNGMPVGETVTAVGEPGTVDGRRVVIVRSRFDAADALSIFERWSETLDSWIALDERGLMRHRTSVTKGSKTSTLESDVPMFGSSLTLGWERTGKSDAYVLQRLPARRVVHDLHSALGVLRARHWGQPGETASLYALSGGRLWHHALRLSDRRSVTTPVGRFPAIRIDGAAYRLTRSNHRDADKKPRHYSLWLSSDERRLPLRVITETRYGTVEMELISYRAPDEDYVPSLASSSSSSSS